MEARAWCEKEGHGAQRTDNGRVCISCYPNAGATIKALEKERDGYRDGYEDAEKLRLEMGKRVYNIALSCDKVPGLQDGHCPDGHGPRDNLTRIQLAFDHFADLEKRLADMVVNGKQISYEFQRTQERAEKAEKENHQLHLSISDINRISGDTTDYLAGKLEAAEKVVESTRIPCTCFHPDDQRSTHMEGCQIAIDLAAYDKSRNRGKAK